MSRAVSFKYFSQSYSGGLPSVIPFTLQTSDKSKAFLKLRPDTESYFYFRKSLKFFNFFLILFLHLAIRSICSSDMSKNSFVQVLSRTVLIVSIVGA